MNDSFADLPDRLQVSLAIGRILVPLIGPLPSLYSGYGNAASSEGQNSFEVLTAARQSKWTGKLNSSNSGFLTGPTGYELDTTMAQIFWTISPWRSEGLGKFKLHMTQGGHDSIIHEFEVSN